MSVKDYMLTIRIPIDAVDDVAARVKARAILRTINTTPDFPSGTSKLQEVHSRRQPRNVRLETGS